MKINTLFTTITAVLIAAFAVPITAQQNTESNVSPTILIDATHNNGSFEKGMGGWSKKFKNLSTLLLRLYYTRWTL